MNTTVGPAAHDNDANEAAAGQWASYPALVLEQNGQRFYFATMPVADVFPYCYVASRLEDPIEGFQRTLSEERADAIAQYLDQSQGSIPTNIVLSAQPVAEVRYNPRTKTVRYRRIKRAFLVLDGQHRLYGYGRTKKAHRVPVAIYENLTRKEEAALFIDINTTQRGVPAALLLDIKQVAQQENVVEARLRLLFDRLNTDTQSPLAGLLSPSKSLQGRISRVTFNRGVEQILRNVVMTKLGDETQFTLLRNYFVALERSLRKSTLLRKAAYFEAFCVLFEDVVQLAGSKHSNYKVESLTDVLSALRNVDLEHLLTEGHTKITRALILPVLKNALSGQIDVREDMI